MMMEVILVHWKPDEAKQHVEDLRDAGFDVVVLAPRGGSADLRAISADAILIDLTRQPMQGRAVGVSLRQRVATRQMPLVFMGGAPEKVEAVRQLLPDAGYLGWTDVAGQLEKTIRKSPKTPVVVETMAGYSGTPLPKKLGIKQNSIVALIGAPDAFESKLIPMPEDVRLTSKARGADRVVLFVRSMKDLEQKWTGVTDTTAPNSTVWIAWPKQASGIQTDVNETKIRAHGMGAGWVDYKVCAIDETWSGLAFARRKAASTGSSREGHDGKRTRA
jgi:hypothetical protein